MLPCHVESSETSRWPGEILRDAQDDSDNVQDDKDGGQDYESGGGRMIAGDTYITIDEDE